MGMRDKPMISAAKLTTSPSRLCDPSLPPLENGDRLTQAEFHRRYQAYPDDVKFELIGGIVYMASPVLRLHGTYHLQLGLAFGHYASRTAGVEAGDNATTILGEESEPQPDLTLRLLREYGGRSRLNARQYVVGPPELLAEVAHSTVAIDMHQKRIDYQLAGVLEYLVLCLEEQEIYWFHFKSRRSIMPDARGIYRSRVFPGLWIDGPALLARDSARLIEVVQQGLVSPEHARFVKRLQTARRKRLPR
jgi:Uma2 family endonuclease